MTKDKKEIRWLIKKSKHIHYLIITICILNLISSILSVGFALVTKDIIDIATGKDLTNVLASSLTLVLLIFIQLLLRSLTSYYSTKAFNKFEMGLKDNLFRAILRKDWMSVSKYHSGELVSRLNNDVGVVTSGIISFVPGVVSLVSSLITALFVLFTLDYVFAIIILCIGPVFLIFGRLYGRIIKKMHTKCQESSANIRSYIQEALQNLIVIKSFENEVLNGDKLITFQKINYNLQMKRNLYSLVSNGGMYLGFWAGYFFAIVWGAYRLSTGFISFGTLTAFFQLSSQVQGPFMSIGSMISSIYGSFASATRIMEIEDMPDEKFSNSNHSVITNFTDIAFHNVAYRYGNEIILKNINLSIKRGEFVIITGESGVGKTTLLRLLLGLISPESGNLQFNYNENSQLDIGINTRSLFAYVPQGNIIFSGTIKENISFSNPGATIEEIEYAAKCACLLDFIQELPDQFDTIIGERGLGLSEGQTQRLAIARAILYKAPILILDEATSALDSETEFDVLNNIRELGHLWTCIIVSHRKTAFDFCDSIINIGTGGQLREEEEKLGKVHIGEEEEKLGEVHIGEEEEEQLQIWEEEQVQTWEENQVQVRVDMQIMEEVQTTRKSSPNKISHTLKK